MCQCLMAEFNVPSFWVCEIHTCEHTSCPPRREPSDLLLVLELMKRLSFVISMIACSSHTCRCCKCTAMIPSSLFWFTFPEIAHRFSQNRKVQNHIFTLHSRNECDFSQDHTPQNFLSALKKIQHCLFLIIQTERVKTLLGYDYELDQKQIWHTDFPANCEWMNNKHFITQTYINMLTYSNARGNLECMEWKNTLQQKRSRELINENPVTVTLNIPG